MNIEISDKQYVKLLNWYDGMLYVSLLTIDDKNDWRLPTEDELDYIYHSENDFNDCNGSYYWTSTEHTDNKHAWTLNFRDSSHGYSPKNNIFYVRPVRNLTL
jgi:hypothetical protein